jgi:hypothetical protein
MRGTNQMIDRHIRNLRLDRRLLSRRDWISPQELEEALQALPDAAGKAELVTEPAGSEAAEPAAPPEQATH